MLEQGGEQAFADEQVRNLVIDVSSFSRNREELYNVRKAMARRIEQMNKKK